MAAGKAVRVIRELLCFKRVLQGSSNLSVPGVIRVRFLSGRSLMKNRSRKKKMGATGVNLAETGVEAAVDDADGNQSRIRNSQLDSQKLHDVDTGCRHGDGRPGTK